MKKPINILLVVIAMTIGVSAYAQDKAFKDGTVWSVSLIKSTSNMGEQYLTNLKTTWVAVHDEAVKQGLILSYKVLSGSSSNPGDWDIMLLVEYKNLASMEGQDDKWDAIFKKVVGNEDAQKKLAESRVSMRTIYGEKLMREVSYK
jgi:hypothetical protein